MGALTTITANDQTPVTPVTFTFVPAGKTKDGYWIFEQTVPAPTNGLAAVRMHCRLVRDDMKPSAGTRMGSAARINAKLWIPIMETLSTNDAGFIPPPQVAYTCFAEVTYVVPERSTEQNRKDLRSLSSTIIGNNGILTDMLYKLQDLY